MGERRKQSEVVGFYSREGSTERSEHHDDDDDDDDVGFKYLLYLEKSKDMASRLYGQCKCSHEFLLGFGFPFELCSDGWKWFRACRDIA